MKIKKEYVYLVVILIVIYLLLNKKPSTKPLITTGTTKDKANERTPPHGMGVIPVDPWECLEKMRAHNR